MKLTTHLYLVSRSKNAWSYTSTPPICLHGVVRSEAAQRQLYLLPYTIDGPYENVNIRSIGKGEARHRKYKRFKFHVGQVETRSIF